MSCGPEELWFDMAVGYLWQRLHHGVQEGPHPHSHLQQLQHCGRHVCSMVTAALAQRHKLSPSPRSTDYRKRNVKSCQVFSISCYSPWPFYIAPRCLDTIKILWIAASPTLRLGESVITLPGSSFPTLSVLDSSPSSGYHEQFLSQPWGYFPTSIGYPLSYMIHWGMIYTSLPEGCISNWKLHVFLILKGIQCTENTLFPPLETQQHLISPPAPSWLRWGL